MEQTFVIVYRPGPAWLAGLPLSAQPLEAHVDYMQELKQAGQVRLAGPYADETGGLVVLRTMTESQAQNVLSHDPAIINQILAAELHPWTLMIDVDETEEGNDVQGELIL